MVNRLLTGSLLLAVLGCLMVGCSDDTQRITSPSTESIQADPLSTSFDDLNDQSGSFVDDGYFYDPWNMDVTDEDVIASGDDSADGSEGDEDVSDKPIDKGTN